MKYGVRKPNVKKSIKARTTGKVKRQVKKAVNPLYGKKGMGIVNDPKKAAYNAVYKLEYHTFLHHSQTVNEFHIKVFTLEYHTFLHHSQT